MKKNLFLIACSIFAITTINAQWSLSGNSISSGNFLGTTNAQNLVFKVNNSFAGIIDGTTNQNTYLGYEVGAH